MPNFTETERLETANFLDWCERTTTPTTPSEPRSGERNESPLGSPCDCGESISARRAEILARDGKPLTCKSCADASHIPYRADSATTSDGQILELVIHRTTYANGVRLGGANGLLTLAR